MSPNEEKRKLLHKIRNCLGPIQTFLEVVDTGPEDENLKKFHQSCKESAKELTELLKKLENL